MLYAFCSIFKLIPMIFSFKTIILKYYIILYYLFHHPFASTLPTAIAIAFSIELSIHQYPNFLLPNTESTLTPPLLE